MCDGSGYTGRRWEWLLLRWWLLLLLRRLVCVCHEVRSCRGCPLGLGAPAPGGRGGVARLRSMSAPVIGLSSGIMTGRALGGRDWWDWSRGGDELMNDTERRDFVGELPWELEWELECEWEPEDTCRGVPFVSNDVSSRRGSRISFPEMPSPKGLGIGGAFSDPFERRAERLLAFGGGEVAGVSPDCIE